MTVMAKIASWRKPKPKSAAPKSTSADRQAAIDKLAEIESARARVDELQKIADQARSDRDAAEAALDASQAVYALAQREASSLGASLDSQSVRQRAVLRRTCSPLIAEFIESCSALLRDLRADGVSTSAPPSGEFTLDGHAHKQPWSTFKTAGRRAVALVVAIRTAESMRFSPMREADVETALQRLYESLPKVAYQKC